MSRRSSRSRSSSGRRSSGMPIPESVCRGLASLVTGNESCVSKMLSSSSSESSELVADLQDCMRVNHLSAEMLLARFFNASVLSEYSSKVLGKSGKGSEATLAARIAREWAKPSFQPSTAGEKPPSKKQKLEERESSVAKGDEEKDDDDNDWRKPLFYWKGKLTWKHETWDFEWSGSWESALAEEGVPKSSEYDSTKDINSFRLQGTCRTKKKKSDATVIDALVAAEEWTLQGEYRLDQSDGNGPQDYRDNSHLLVFEKNEDYLLACACGTTEFGVFVSAGYAEWDKNGSNSNPNELDFVLARRYIDDADARNNLIKGGARKVMDDLHRIRASDAERRVLDPRSRDTRFWSQFLPRTRHSEDRSPK